MTDGQDYGQPGEYPQPGYGQQYGPPGQPYPQPGHGQQYRPEDQPRQPQYDPRQHQRRTSGPQEAPWQQAPYPPQDYPPRDQWQPRQPRQDYRQFQPRQRHHRKRSRAPLYAGIAAVIVIAGGGTAYALARHGSPATSASAATPASLSQLKKIVLQPADLPSGWKGRRYQPGPNDSANNAALAKCVGARNTASDMVAEAHSDGFALGYASISSSASSVRSQSGLDADVAMLRSPKLSLCFGQMMKKQLAASLPAGATIESASIKITPGSAGGPANVIAAGTGTIKVSVSGRQVPTYLTMAFITGPLIEAEVDTTNIGTPVPASVVNRLVATVATRAVKG